MTPLYTCAAWQSCAEIKYFNALSYLIMSMTYVYEYCLYARHRKFLCYTCDCVGNVSGYHGNRDTSRRHKSLNNKCAGDRLPWQVITLMSLMIMTLLHTLQLSLITQWEILILRCIILFNCSVLLCNEGSLLTIFSEFMAPSY